MKHLKKILKGKNTLIFIDFEGTQFTHEIIATGILKCHIDEEGNILEETEGKLIYTKARSSIGKVVTKITSITEEFLKENGISWEETINQIHDYVGDDLDHTLFVCFGSNDPRMIIESCRYSRSENSVIAKTWLEHFFDFMTFMSQYIRDDKGNTYSLVNFLKLYGVDPIGTSHNPLNDAIDLKNLFKAFLEKEEVRFDEYQKVLSKLKAIPSPVQEVIKRLINGENVTSEEFKNSIKDYLA